jgi:hypothetical protein
MRELQHDTRRNPFSLCRSICLFFILTRRGGNLPRRARMFSISTWRRGTPRHAEVFSISTWRGENPSSCRFLFFVIQFRHSEEEDFLLVVPKYLVLSNSTQRAGTHLVLLKYQPQDLPLRLQVPVPWAGVWVLMGSFTNPLMVTYYSLINLLELMYDDFCKLKTLKDSFRISFKLS